MAKPLGYPKFRHLLPDGSPAVGYKLYSYLSGTVTPTPLYTSQDQSAQHPQPALTDGNGEIAIWLAPNVAYKLVLRTVADADVWTLDGLNVAEGGYFTTLNVTGAAVFAAITASGQITSSGQIVSMVVTGASPFVVASTTLVNNLNADLLKGKTWASPDPIGITTPNISKFTTLEATGPFNEYANGTQYTANLASWVRGNLSEEVTLSTVGTTTDSVANLLPANSIIEAVVARVTQTITTATDWKLGDATQAARFTAAQSGAQLVLGATIVGLNHADPTVATANLGPVQNAAAKLRITTTGISGSGRIRITVFYRQFVTPTS